MLRVPSILRLTKARAYEVLLFTDGRIDGWRDRMGWKAGWMGEWMDGRVDE
jgi:hypothetical protein